MINTHFHETYKSIICLNSCIPYDDIKRLNLPIIATDGSANQLINNGILPTYIIGDMDSIHADILNQFNCIHISDQNTTDFDKAVDFAKNHDLYPSIITGVDGGFLDHSLNNFSTFVKLQSALYVSAENFGFCVSNCTKKMSLPIGTKISIFGAPSADVITKGLKWEINNERLSFFSYNSCSNRTNQNEIEITAKNGTVFVLIYRHKINDAGVM